MMMPIPPSAVLNVIQAGYPVDAVLRLTVQSVNGVDNRRVQLQHVRPADPEFYLLLRAPGSETTEKRRCASLGALLSAYGVLQKDPMVGVRALAREMGIKAAWAETVYRDAPPSNIFEWATPRYPYSQVKDSAFHRRLGYHVLARRKGHFEAGGCAGRPGRVGHCRGVEDAEPGPLRVVRAPRRPPTLTGSA